MMCAHEWYLRNTFLTCVRCGVTPSPERQAGQWPRRDFDRVMFPRTDRC